MNGHSRAMLAALAAVVLIALVLLVITRWPLEVK